MQFKILAGIKSIFCHKYTGITLVEEICNEFLGFKFTMQCRDMDNNVSDGRYSSLYGQIR